MLLKQLLNNLPIFLEGLLNCICTHISIKVNVFIQKNAYHINISRKQNCEASFRIIFAKYYSDKFAHETKLENCLLLLEEHVTTQNWIPRRYSMPKPIFLKEVNISETKSFC